MGKNRRKRSRPNSSTNDGPWKSLSVTLSSQGLSSDTENKHGDGEVNGVELTEEYTSNHYDDPKLSKKAELDLPMDPGEDCGMFYGLEVLDASQYKVENNGAFKRLIVTGDTEESTHITSESEAQKNSTSESNSTDMGDKSNVSEPKKKKKKKNKDKKKKNGEDEETSTKESSSKSPQEQEPVTPEQLAKIQLSWSRSSGGAHLHNRLLESLHRLGFTAPTPIQAATLSASTMGRRNLVGAAPTGSGKTLAFLLPILNNILQKQDEKTDDETPENILQALIVTPTRGKLCIRFCIRQ